MGEGWGGQEARLQNGPSCPLPPPTLAQHCCLARLLLPQLFQQLATAEAPLMGAQGRGAVPPESMLAWVRRQRHATRLHPHNIYMKK